MKSKIFKSIALFLILNMVFQMGFPCISWALTGGPSQPEAQSYTPAGAADMVDLFSGDFKYSVPLLDVGGYPITLAYSGGVNMDQEASWVGLGWNVNPGSISRSMRGLPDDFDGEGVMKSLHIKPNKTYSIGIGAGEELAGLSDKSKGHFSLDLGINIFKNNYKGWGYEFSIDPAISAGQKMKPSATLDLGLKFNSQEGIGVNPNLSFSSGVKKSKTGETSSSFGLHIGAPYNSRAGMKAMSFGYSIGVNADHQNTRNKKTNTRSDKLAGMNGGYNLSFADNTYIPEIDRASHNLNLSFKTTFGTENNTHHPHGYLTGYLSEQSFEKEIDTVSAFGYLYIDKGASRNDVMLDFNREKDGAYNKNLKNLPVTNFTYDLYSVQAEGLSGSFRPHRSDVGILHDRDVQCTSVNDAFGTEFGSVNLLKLGANVGLNSSESHSGNWTYQNELTSHLSFKGKTDVPLTEYLFEPFYFKNAGEKAVIDENFYDKVGQDHIIAPAISSSGVLQNLIDAKKGTVLSSLKSNNRKTERDRRNQHMSFLNAWDALHYGLDKNIISVNENTVYRADGRLDTTIMNRLSGIARMRHISEISVLKEDGSRYIFGIPAYNINQTEASFNVSGRTFSRGKGQVAYDPTDNSLSNSRGLDEFFSSTLLPSYAHSYLLTAILSADYVDLTGDGITDDDYGTATKFNYTRVYGGSNPYKWRVPYEENKANFNDGLRSDNKDDKGSILYGEKEVWYLHSIETKHYIAEFKISKRRDGKGVVGENGGMDSTFSLRKLDRIELYAKEDRMRFRSKARPIKTVHFEYSYRLCPGIENNDSVAVDRFGRATSIPLANVNAGKGKLTLERVFFTYEKSKKGVTEAYKFTYSDYNPGYNLKGYDRWGNYKPNPAFSWDMNPGVPPFNADFPYTEQNTDSARQYTSAWQLTKIDLPGGGQIKVEYESDDYAYVQDKRAMQMFKIIGADRKIINPDTFQNELYDTDLVAQNTYLFFRLQENISSTAYTQAQANHFVWQQYLDSGKLDMLYFKFLVRLKGQAMEYVSGYTKIDSWGVLENASGKDFTTGYIKIKPADAQSGSNGWRKDVNPITVAAWQFLRLNTPDLLYNGSPTADANPSVVGKSMMNYAADIKRMFGGYFRYCHKEGYGKEFTQNKSFIRLTNPNKKKLGGGLRVSKIVMHDNWSKMAGNPKDSSSEYGQVYDYTMDERLPNGSTRKISSGVASYEPMMGGDENPWHQPLLYESKHALVPDDEHYQETPYGECFFPGAGVGYSKVTVRSLPHPGVNRTATGRTENEFYTAKDFPVFVSNTSAIPLQVKSKALEQLFLNDIEDYMTVSQGFLVELNDMHGKEKSTLVYDENKLAPISGTRHYYKRDPQNPKKLSNETIVLDQSGVAKTATVGVDVDMVNDVREDYSSTHGTNQGFNFDAISAGTPVVVVPIVTYWPSFSSEHTQFRSAVTTKVVMRYGIQEKTQAFDNSSLVTTTNMAYDKETGQTLLTSLQNEWNDTVYNFTYPAHWTYDGMGQAYRNQGAMLSGLNVIAGEIEGIPNLEDYFVPGDEVHVSGRYTTLFNKGFARPFWERYWVQKFPHGLHLVDRVGNKANFVGNIAADSFDIEVLRSGRRNMQANPVGQITTLYNPLRSGLNHKIRLDKNILNTSATEFSEDWQTFGKNSPHVVCDIVTQQGKDLQRLLSDQCRFNRFTPDLLGNSNVIYDTAVVTTSLVDPNFAWYGNSYLRKYNDTLNFPDTSCIPTVYQHRFLVYPKKLYNMAKSVLRCKIVTYNVSPCTHVDLFGCEITLTTNILNFNFQDTDIDSLSNLRPKNPSYGKAYNFEITVYYSPASHKAPVVLQGLSCIQVGACHEECFPLTQNQKINPYIHSIKGSWRPKRSYVYLTNRDSAASVSNIRKDGTFIKYTPFWKKNSNDHFFRFHDSDLHWVWQSEISKYSPHGYELERVDPLGRYSQMIHNFYQSVASAQSDNSKSRQSVFDAFEDYDYTFFSNRTVGGNKQKCAPGAHFKFNNIASHARIDTAVSHTGTRSLYVLPGHAVIETKPIKGNSLLLRDTVAFYVDDSDLIEEFNPDPNQKYMVSIWVKQNQGSMQNLLTYTQPELDIVLSDSSGYDTTRFYAHGPIIEGWQQISGTFKIPLGKLGIGIKLKGKSLGVYYDDLRIHPFNSNMKTYVYHPVNMKLLAETDENNFSTIYEYDEEGQLIRVKKETERGVMTVKEIRANKSKIQWR